MKETVQLNGLLREDLVNSAASANLALNEKVNKFEEYSLLYKYLRKYTQFSINN